MITLKCKTCNKEFKTKNLKDLTKRQKYCSTKCCWDDKEYKNKAISRIQGICWNRGTKGIMKPNETSFIKGASPWNKGIKFEKISLENHWNWQGGKQRNI